MKKVFFITFIVLVLDQALKFWVKTNMFLYDSIDVTGWFKILFVENPGMAFGMQISESPWGKIILVLFRVGVVASLFVWLKKLCFHRAPSILIIPLSLVFAGAVGNIIDSLFYGIIFSGSNGQIAEFLPEAGGYAPFMFGLVVDMFYFPIWSGPLPLWLPVVGGERFEFFSAVFNIADAAVFTGIALLLIFHYKAFDGGRLFSKSDSYKS